jgi:hypothetical protein
VLKEEVIGIGLIKAAHLEAMFLEDPAFRDRTGPDHDDNDDDEDKTGTGRETELRGWVAVFRAGKGEEEHEGGEGDKDEAAPKINVDAQRVLIHRVVGAGAEPVNSEHNAEQAEHQADRGANIKLHNLPEEDVEDEDGDQHNATQKSRLFEPRHARLFHAWG